MFLRIKRSQFGKLRKMIGTHAWLKEHSRFLFIPDPDDAGPSTVLPKCALPKYLAEELQNYIPNIIFSSNPYRMRRSCLVSHSSEETNDPFEHVIISSFLSPLIFQVSSVLILTVIHIALWS